MERGGYSAMRCTWMRASVVSAVSVLPSASRERCAASLRILPHQSHDKNLNALTRETACINIVRTIIVDTM